MLFNILEFVAILSCNDSCTISLAPFSKSNLPFFLWGVDCINIFSLDIVTDWWPPNVPICTCEYLNLSFV